VFLRHLSAHPVRVLLIVAAGFALSLVLALDGDQAGPAQANPAYGTVKLALATPPFVSSIVLENHSFSVPVQITTCADNTTAPSFTAESAGATTITDNNASWTVNQWAGYDIQLTAGIGSPQWRTVVSNTATTLTLDSAWGGIVDTGTATGGTTTTIVDLGSGWLTNEFASDLGDGNPMFVVEFTGPEGPQTRTVTSNTSDTLTVTPAYAAYLTDTASGGTSTTLVDAGKSWTTNQWANKSVEIASGLASVQSRRILSNTADTLTIDGTWTATTGGSATSGTTTTLTDASQNWTVNAFAGKSLELISGTGAPALALIASNTANTITITGSFTTAPANGTLYRVLAVPDATSQYTIRDGASINSTFQIKQTSPVPGAGTQFELFKSACRIGGYDITMGYNDTRLEVTSDGGVSSGGNTVTTFNDTTRSWKRNQWSGARITITGGGPASGQTQIVVSNTKTQLVVTPGWNTTPPNTVPGAGAYYTLGGITDAGWVTSTTPARTVSCPGGQIFGPATARLRCVTYGESGTGLPQGKTGTGNLVNLTMTAIGRGLATFTLTSQIVEVDGTTIPADTLNGSRRVILCPDGTGDGRITSSDMLKIAKAFGQRTGDPLYTIYQDPDENGLINSADQLEAVAVFLQYCVQQVVSP
jgi:hypothetical protein